VLPLLDSELSMSERPVEGPSERVKIGCKVGVMFPPIEGPAPGMAGGGIFEVLPACGTAGPGFMGATGALEIGFKAPFGHFREPVLLLVRFLLLPEDCWGASPLITFDVVSLRAIQKAGGSENEVGGA
jgi:hypothetical protein